ncbi:MAG: hypothetical protein ACRC4K_02200 [Plesiomonas shigelloides]
MGNPVVEQIQLAMSAAKAARLRGDRVAARRYLNCAAVNRAMYQFDVVLAKKMKEQKHVQQ